VHLGQGPSKPDWVFATASVDIRRQLDEVFAFVCNPLNDPQWNRKVAKIEKLTVGPIGVGTVFRQAAAFGGGRIESEWQITEYEPSHLFHGKSTRGLFHFDGGYRFVSNDGITHVTKYASFDLARILPPFISKSLAGSLLSKEFDASFDSLKRLLDQRV
jgi:hypothetical protein